MKKILFPILASLLLLSFVIVVGCSKTSTTPLPQNNPPSAITNFTASQSSNRAVNLRWTNPTGVDTFFLQSSEPDSSTYRDLATLLGTDTTYSDSGLTADIHTFYRIKAHNAYGVSDYAYASLWTLPAIWDFATDATGVNNFDTADLGTITHTWSTDAGEGVDGAGSGKLTIESHTGNGAIAAVVSNYQMNNTGWFQSYVRVGLWQGRGDTANYAAFFMESHPQEVNNNIVGVFFYPDSTILEYYSSGADTAHGIREATNPALPLLTSNTWHLVRFFHNGTHWDFYVDNVLKWSGEIQNVAQTGQLYEEWQFGASGGTDPQNFWVDNWANPHGTPPVLMTAGTPHSASSSLDGRITAHRK